MAENLGQHFLQDADVLADIVAAGDISADDVILEVGPGQGVLTEKLLEEAGRVVAVEKDPALVAELKERFSEAVEAGRLDLIKADIRDIDPADYGLGSGRYKLIANIPYYLTGQLIEQTLSGTRKPSRVVLLVQKEVAERIIADDGKESILSLSVKTYGNPKLIRAVSPDSFSPSPTVDSAILSITDVSQDFFADINEAEFFSLVKRGFGQKRKKLSNNLDTDLRFSKKQAEVALEKCDLDTNIRAEKLSIHDWKCLIKNLV